LDRGRGVCGSFLGGGGGWGWCDREEGTGVGGQMVRYTFYYFEVARFASVRFVDFRSEYCESQSFSPERDEPGCARGLVRVVI